MRDYGKCVIIEGVCEHTQRMSGSLDDLYILIHAVEKMVEIAEMTLIEPPRPVASKLSPPFNGWTVTATMDQSSIAIHSFPKQMYCRLTIDSCKDFDEKKIGKRFAELFCLDETKMHVIETGGL